MWQYVYPVWNKEQPRHIDISKVGQFLGEETCKALQGCLAYTRCYSLSAFSGLVKVSTLTLLMNGGGDRLLKAMEGLVRPGFCQRNCLHCGKSLCEKNVCFTHLSMQSE